MRKYLERSVRAYSDFQSRARWPFVLYMGVLLLASISLTAFILWDYAYWTADLLNIPMNEPACNAPYVWVWLGLFMVGFAIAFGCCLTLLGLTLSHSLFAAGFLSREEANALGIYGEGPTHWLKPASSQSSPNQKCVRASTGKRAK